jgi:hypothetical protein
MVNKMRKPAIYLLVTFLLGGCGELSYKQGASVQDLEATKKQCQSNSEQSLETCLKQNGWVVQNLDRMDILVDEVTTTTTTTQGNADTIVEKPAEDVTIQMTSNNQTLKPTKPAPVEKKMIEKSSHPLDTFKISSWWKIGSNDQHFRQDANQCQAGLGEEHAPVTKTQTYTRAFISCMQSHDWKALKVAQ